MHAKVTKMNLATLLLGSNIEPRDIYISNAVELIRAEIGKVINISEVYQTQAWGIESQNAFLNQVILVETELNHLEVLNKTSNIEARSGRRRVEKFGPRTLDIDILFFNELVYQSETLQIPHPGIPNRRFTLVPLVELLPNYIHPVLLKTNLDLLKECPDNLTVSVWKTIE